MKARWPSQEKTQDQVRSVRITLSSKNVKNLEKVCAELVGGANKRLKVKEDEGLPEKVSPITTRSPCDGRIYNPQRPSRRSKKGITNFRWSPAMTCFLLPFLVEQVKLNMTFKKDVFMAAAEAVSEKFKLQVTGRNVENHLRTVKTRYLQIRKLQSLSNAIWDEKQKKIIMDDKSYKAHISAHPKDEPFLNQSIDMYDEMAIVCNDDKVSESDQVPESVANEDTRGNIEAALPPELTAGDDVIIVKDEDVEIEDVGEETPRPLSRSPQVSTSSGSTGRTGESDKKNYSHYLVDKINYLASQIGELAESIRSSRRDISSELFSEVMKCEGYDEASLGRAFDYLNEHENLARGFLAKNHNLRKAWLSHFFSDDDQIA